MQPRKNPRQSLGYLASVSPSPDGGFAEIPLFTRRDRVGTGLAEVGYRITLPVG